MPIGFRLKEAGTLSLQPQEEKGYVNTPIEIRLMMKVTFVRLSQVCFSKEWTSISKHISKLDNPDKFIYMQNAGADGAANVAKCIVMKTYHNMRQVVWVSVCCIFLLYYNVICLCFCFAIVGSCFICTINLCISDRWYMVE